MFWKLRGLLTALLSYCIDNIKIYLLFKYRQRMLLPGINSGLSQWISQSSSCPHSFMYCYLYMEYNQYCLVLFQVNICCLVLLIVILHKFVKSVGCYCDILAVCHPSRLLVAFLILSVLAWHPVGLPFKNRWTFIASTWGTSVPVSWWVQLSTIWHILVILYSRLGDSG